MEAQDLSIHSLVQLRHRVSMDTTVWIFPEYLLELQFELQRVEK